MNKYNTIIFDLDGTLVNTLDDLADSVNFALQEFGFPQRTTKEVRSFVGNGVRKLIERALPSDVTADKFEKVYDLFKSHYFENCLIKTKPYDGIIPLLENLKKQNYKTAIVSNKYQDAVDEIKKLFFDNLIDTEVGESEHMPGKPSPDMVFKAVNDLKTSVDKCLYVGDSDVDYHCAVNAGMDRVLVSWGFKDKDVLMKLGDVNIIDTPDELYKYL